MDKYTLGLISHRMNLGDINNKLNNQVDNSYGALKSLTTKDIKSIAGFECDLRLTKDKVLVLVHDETTKSITKNKLNKNISDLTYNELEKICVKDIVGYYKRLILGSYLLPDSGKFRKVIREKMEKDTIIQKAYDMFEYLLSIDYKGQIILEIKADTEDCKNEIIKLINKYKNSLNILIHGYYHDKVLEIKEKTDIKAGFLYNGDRFKTVYPSENYIKNNKFDFYSIMWGYLSNKLIKNIIDNKKDLYIWTIDSVFHVWIILNRLQRHYNKHKELPKHVYLITNIPLIIKSYFDKTDSNNNFIRAVNKKYYHLYLGK